MIFSALTIYTHRIVLQITESIYIFIVYWSSLTGHDALQAGHVSLGCMI